MKLISKLVSWIFIPLLFPTIALAIVLYVPSEIEYCYQPNCLFNIQQDAKFPLLALVSMFTLIFPLLFVIILRYGQFIDSIEMETSKERNLPIVIMFFCCTALFIFMKQKFVGDLWPPYIYAFPLSGMILSAAMFPLNLWKKVSIHASGTGVFVGFILAYSVRHGFYPIWPLALGLFLSGLIISARLTLEKHSMLEVAIGWSVALIITFSTNYWYP